VNKEELSGEPDNLTDPVVVFVMVVPRGVR
jgi:hypothetical protein